MVWKTVSVHCGLRRIGVRRSGVVLLHHPWRELADPVDRVISDAGEEDTQISLGIPSVHLGCGDERVEDGRAPAALHRACDQVFLPPQGNPGDILPISGRRWSPTITGTSCMGVDYGGRTANSARTARLSSWKSRWAWSLPCRAGCSIRLFARGLVSALTELHCLLTELGFRRSSGTDIVQEDRHEA